MVSEAPTQALLRLVRVSRTFQQGDNQVQALREVTLSIRRGEFVAIMGQSGSGKSTLMNILGCLDTPTAGCYQVLGHDTRKLDPEQLSSLRLKVFGFVFQRYQLLANLTALDNVAMPAIYSGKPIAERQQRAADLLLQLGLADRAQHKPSELSGGQQQRVSIARALINGAEVILADEPTGALDSASGQQVLELLEHLHSNLGTTIILITHDAEVARHAQRIVQMKDGEIVSDSGQSDTDQDAVTAQTPLVRLPRIGVTTSLGLAMRSLHANLFRTLLTLLGIIIGVAAVVSMMAIGHGGKQQVLDRIAAMGSNLLQVRTGGRNLRAMGDIATLSLADAEAITQLPGITVVAPERESRGTLRHGANDYSGRIRGITPDYFNVRDWELAQGVFLEETDLLSYGAVMVLGATVAELLFPEGNNPVGEYVLMNNTPYLVIGVLRSKGASAGGGDMDDEAYIPISTAQLRLVGSAYLSSITIKVSDAKYLDEVQESVTQLLKQRHGKEDFMVRNTAFLVEAVSETQDTLTYLLAAVAAISLLVGGIGVMNIMLVNVSERRREIGLRIATGAKPADILRQFNIEALLVCVLGGLIGVALGIMVSLTLRVFNVAIVLSLVPPLLAFGTSLAIGWIFGYAPAHKAASLNPITALAED